MKAVAIVLMLGLASSFRADGQKARVPPPQARPSFRLDLMPLYRPGYESARELRLALWDSPVSRMELATAREAWALRNPGPIGTAMPPQHIVLPLRFDLDNGSERLFVVPRSPGWEGLTWQEKVAAGAQTCFVLWALVEVAGHAR